MIRSLFIAFVFILSKYAVGQLCPGPTGPNLFPEGDFGTGTANLLQTNLGIAPGYIFITNDPAPDDGEYCITNNIGMWNETFGWLEIGDNSADPNGYMMVVNASYDPGLFYEKTISGLCENTSYEFSCDIINLHGGTDPFEMIEPDVTFLINGASMYTTGDIQETGQWNTFGFLFTTGPGQTSVTLGLRNNADGGIGNDLAIDNISFSQCGPEVILPLQEEMQYFENYCQGLTVPFENYSYGTDTYEWDFGVLGTDTDIVQGVAPVFTFPSPGIYQVIVTANPGSACSDVDTMNVKVYEEIHSVFEVPPFQCVTGNSYDFEGQGTFPASGTTFEWTFDNAVPGSSTDQDPTGIVFQSPGWHNVKFKVMFDQCVAQTNQLVQVVGLPIINFGISDELKCVPYTAEFVNLSQAATPITSVWDLGDGTISNETHPVHVYEQVGVYDVSLTIWTEAGCIDTLTMVRPNLIEVFPRPTAGFVVSPPEANEYEANFFFEDQSFDGVESWYHFGDYQTSNLDTVWHFYNEPGVYHPWQIVYNEHGCSDRAQAQLTVTPIIPIIVPNAFTPNADEYNNILQPILYEDQVYELQIFNRWGEMIHKSKEWNANWDGTYQGVLVPDGTYIWKVIYTDFKTGLPVEVQGHVLVLK